MKLTVIMKNMMICNTKSRRGVRFGSAPSASALADITASFASRTTDLCPLDEARSAEVPGIIVFVALRSSAKRKQRLPIHPNMHGACADFRYSIRPAKTLPALLGGDCLGTTGGRGRLRGGGPARLF